jgi:hypothetical protein
MSNRSSPNRVILLTLFLLAAPACNGGGVALSEVEGTVLWKKKPLRNVQVQFLPDVETGTHGPRSTGITDDQGHYTLFLDDEQPGAVVGHHRVLLFEIGNDPIRDRKTAERRDPKARSGSGPVGLGPLLDRYHKAATTPLKREVRSGKQIIDFDLP